MQSPQSLEIATRPNLTKKMRDLISDGDEIGVTDPSLATVSFRFRLRFKS
jgi:ubiquitin-activating enzyme E1 C